MAESGLLTGEAPRALTGASRQRRGEARGAGALGGAAAAAAFLGAVSGSAGPSEPARVGARSSARRGRRSGLTAAGAGPAAAAGGQDSAWARASRREGAGRGRPADSLALLGSRGPRAQSAGRPSRVNRWRGPGRSGGHTGQFVLLWNYGFTNRNSNESLIDQHYFTSWNALSEMGIVLLDPTCNRWMLLHADYFFEPVLF
ncbi:uncharacterized protein [Macaca fascicularis]|uniref:uncharacterized protein n=1 Tax=Macaca fascicularis TaxID=9541 RepID=UPI003D1579F2